MTRGIEAPEVGGIYQEGRRYCLELSRRLQGQRRRREITRASRATDDLEQPRKTEANIIKASVAQGPSSLLYLLDVVQSEKVGASTSLRSLRSKNMFRSDVPRLRE